MERKVWTPGWQRIHVTSSEHPYMKHWWVPGCTIGYEHTFTNSLADFLEGLESGTPAQPDLRSAWRTQRVCDAVLEPRSKASLRSPVERPTLSTPRPARYGFEGGPARYSHCPDHLL